MELLCWSPPSPIPFHISPCIMCVQYRGGYHEYREGYLEYSGGYHDKCGGISWVLWGVFSTMGVIMSTMGGYLEYRGGISWCTWGLMSTVEGKSFVIWIPHSTEHPHGTQISKDGIPHGTEHPPRYSWYPPRASWYPPTVLNTPMVFKISPHSTQDIPHSTHDIPPWYWTPHSTAHTLYRVIC